MTHLSQRIKNIQPSPTVALNGRAQALQKQGRKILNFGVGEPDFATPEVIVEQAIKSLRQGRTKYGAAGGGEPLRQAVSQKLKTDNHLNFAASDIVVGIGAKEILFHIFLSILNEGDEVLLTTPCWVSYCDQIRAAGAVPVLVPRAHDNAPWVAPEQLEKFATPRTRAFVLNSPNNPAGYVLTKEELTHLGSYLKSKDWWVVADEIYEYLAFDKPHFSLLELEPALQERFLLVNGLSKGFCMTGWRVGYVAGPPTVTPLVKALQSHSSTSLPGFIEDAAVVALNHGKTLTTEMVQIFRQRRDKTVEFFRKPGRIPFIQPEGAFYIWLDLRQLLAHSKGICTTLDLTKCLLEEYGLVLVPGEAFGTPGFLRLSYSAALPTLEEGVDTLHRALQKLSLI